jgi:hypothetical protein
MFIIIDNFATKIKKDPSWHKDIKKIKEMEDV